MVKLIIYNFVKWNYVFSEYQVNYLSLKTENNMKKKIRPAGHESVQWTIEISSNQNTSLEW